MKVERMKRWVPLALALSFSGSVVYSQRPKQAAPPKALLASRAATPLVTRDNFVSLSLLTYGTGPTQETVEVQSNGIKVFHTGRVSRGFGGGGFGDNHNPSSYVPPTIPLSNNQLNTLLRAVNEANLKALSGKYEQKSLRDGTWEVVTLTISDEQNRDLIFSIENHGDTAPHSFYTLAARLRDFIKLKSPRRFATSTSPTSN